jgi:hypothetical protein
LWIALAAYGISSYAYLQTYSLLTVPRLPVEMIPYNLMEQYKLLQETAQKRIRELQMHETRHLKLLAQLTRFGICPCIAMGRYSTCCGSTSDGEL